MKATFAEEQIMSKGIINWLECNIPESNMFEVYNRIMDNIVKKTDKSEYDWQTLYNEAMAKAN